MFAEEHDKGDFASGDVFADSSSGGDSDGDEDVGVEASSEEGFEGALVDREGGKTGSDDDKRFKVECPAGGEERTGCDGVGELEVEGGAVGLWFCCCGGKCGGVAGLLDGGDELVDGGRWVSECEKGTLGKEVDVGIDDAGNFGEGVLDVTGAVGAGHAGNGEEETFHEGKVHGDGNEVE